jgi:hypothetical protein
MHAGDTTSRKTRLTHAAYNTAGHHMLGWWVRGYPAYMAAAVRLCKCQGCARSDLGQLQFTYNGTTVVPSTSRMLTTRHAETCKSQSGRPAVKSLPG